MIKVRLIKLLSHSKKYVVLQVLWQWISLIAQVMLIFTLSGMIEGLFENTIPAFGICLPILFLLQQLHHLLLFEVHHKLCQ